MREKRKMNFFLPCNDKPNHMAFTNAQIQEFQSSFIAVTGLDPKTNPDAFIQFCQACLMNDLLSEQKSMNQKLQDLLNSFPI
jgi:hypothetical protein